MLKIPILFNIKLVNSFQIWNLILRSDLFIREWEGGRAEWLTSDVADDDDDDVDVDVDVDDAWCCLATIDM